MTLGHMIEKNASRIQYEFVPVKGQNLIVVFFINGHRLEYNNKNGCEWPFS